MLRHIVRLETLGYYRDRTRSSGVFQELFRTYKGCMYPNVFNIHEHASNAAL